jgi:hypothetical protein
MVFIIILAIAGILMFPAYELFMHWGVIGDIITMLMGLGIGWCMCKLSDDDFGIFKLLAKMCIFIILVGNWGIIGWIIAIIVGIAW